MTVRSKQLFVGSFSDTSAHTLYTVPTGFRTIVKCLTVQNAAGSAQHVTISVVLGSGTSAIFSVDLAASGSNGASAILLPWIVLNAGDSLKVTFGSTGGWITASGTELAL